MRTFCNTMNFFATVRSNFLDIPVIFFFVLFTNAEKRNDNRLVEFFNAFLVACVKAVPIRYHFLCFGITTISF